MFARVFVGLAHVDEGRALVDQALGGSGIDCLKRHGFSFQRQ
jgi:hypothetical protein